MRLPDDPPPDVTIRQDISGLHLSYRRPLSARNHILHFIIVLLWIPPFAMPGIVMPNIIKPSAVTPMLRLPVALGGFLGSFLAGLALSWVLYRLAARLLATPAESKLTILAHELRLGERGIPRADVLFVDGSDEPELVLRGGERIPIAPGTPRRTRTWLGEAVRVMVSADEVGTVADIPEALVAMRQASPQSARS